MKSVFSLLILSATTLFHSISAPAQTIPRIRTNLDNNWKFAFGHAAQPEKDFNYGIKNVFVKSGAAAGTAIDAKFNDSGWRSLNLPHDWAVELPFVKVNNFDVQVLAGPK
ncbi:MAG: hypothetical protein H7X88_13415 [Gloeobacteraceae cyanobacterium ES-bin-316]|nr:hypothetical protein [Ferruginibacter sp.]